MPLFYTCTWVIISEQNDWWRSVDLLLIHTYKENINLRLKETEELGKNIKEQQSLH